MGMNNRFIKVFWHADKGSVKDRLGASSANPNLSVVHGGERITKTVTADGEEKVEVEAGEGDDPEKVKEKKDKAIEAIQKNQEMMQLKHDLLKKAEEKRKEALVQQEGLIKSKQTLMEGLIEQQKALIVKLEKGKGVIKLDEKTKIMKLLKELSSSIDRTKEDIKNSLSMATGKNYKDRTLPLSWYSQATPGQGVVGEEQFAEEGGEEADDGYTPPQEDYLPPGLHEHEDILSLASQDEGAEDLNDTNDGPEELNEDLLDDEEEEDDEKSWKRRNNEDD